ncbi:hypothetical protein KP509_14G026200 [Ceratopteris richardii]|uniref:RRM domain-containing protein n=1 Tax=Ceratopteris richardii TaxID=49495 RepID=A0A8T2TBG8_CERRI|nr:hypothetical protein KP509_14G026200 [Ceratopteris richardii]KAH7415068.1 hypothetical protein KP509_14G026200 [Ceratopteris richardii]KAH7415070.1 hypothetical protein KP509_14G026200 [Ceratopteris richardii]KAH7415071.1 hypothetical protein KP509_14G026200 [Ceratopteris richardii]KAH7415073.1 hypothetical protein KP509_14G026200 [Ceratopteris richardii]
MGGIDGPHGGDKKSTLSSLNWSKAVGTPQLNGPTSPAQVLLERAENFSKREPTVDLHGFSTSLPSMLRDNPNGSQLEEMGLDVDATNEMVEPLDDELVSRAIGDILPGNEDELLAGITDGLDFMNLASTTEENEYDLFSSVGGLEMDGDVQDGFGSYMNNHRGMDAFYASGPGFHAPSSNGPGSVIGEHPYGEHPSRTLFVRNINSNVEDSELRALFEQYGDIRTLYTACKHRGFVMISYYDIRSARSAMRALQNKPLRRRKLDIHFSIPKDNPSDKDINQGTLVVFNLDASVSNDDLRQIFGHYGEVKEIRETPHKRHHKFIEFYDVRAAEAALRALNRSDIAGKRIKLEPSRPGGARRSLMQQLSQDSDLEDMRIFRQQSSPPVASSPPGHLSSWGNFGSPVENGLSRPTQHNLGSSFTKSLPGLPVPSASNHSRVGTIGSHLGRNSQMDADLSSLSVGLGGQGIPSHHAHSLPEFGNGGMPYYGSPAAMQVRGTTHGPLASEGLRLPRANSSDVSLFEHAPGALGMTNGGSLRRLNSASAGSPSLSGPQFLWGSNSSNYQQSATQNSWSNPPVNHNYNAAGLGQSQPLGLGQSQAFGYTGNSRYVNNGLSSLRHHVGSAPSGDPSFLERHFGYFRESPDSSYFNQTGMMSLSGTHAGSLGNSTMFEGATSPSLGMMSPRRKNMFPPSGIMMGGYFDMIGVDRGRIRRTDSTASQSDNKKQYQLDIDRILRGEDSRTTLMIKNIPNKYTSKMLLAAIDENHRGMYDFLYLPIDFKNKCNVGYAFINMTSPDHIIPLYQAFNGKKWEKFNSEKVASLAYARIQGKAALVAHFQNSSLMNEDKRCRPILFNSDGPETSEQEPPFLEGGMLTRDQIGTGEFMEASSRLGGNQGSLTPANGCSSLGSPNKE